MTKFFDVKFADEVSDEVRDICSHYGEQVVASTFVSPSQVTGDDELYKICVAAKTRREITDWLTEQSSIKEYRERWIPLRDFVLEIAVIGLIGWEIFVGYQQEKQQSKNFKTQQENFKAQQEILTNLNTSSKATADTLTALKQTTDLELDAMKNSVGVAERSANASEASAATSAKTLHISERAYVAVEMTITPPKVGEKLHFVSTMVNVGKTTATDVRARFSFAYVPHDANEQTAYEAALAAKQDPFTSTTILAAGQRAEQVTDSPDPTTEAFASVISENKITLYAFFRVSYRDLFNHEHHTVQCSKFDTKVQRVVNCATLSKAD
jgi:hypothetical protein